MRRWYHLILAHMAPTPEERASSPEHTLESETFVPPPRPTGLRSSLLTLYGGLALALLFFAIVAETLKSHIPEGKYRTREGTLINIDDFDPVSMGPYPKCHPHHNEYEQVDESGARKWVKVKDAPSAGPFPPGHPENPKFLEESHERATREAQEDMFRWKGVQPTMHLLVMAMLCVIIGSKHALWIFTERPAPDDEGGKTVPQQMLQTEDAYWFPVMGSVLLFSLFVVYKYLGSEFVKQAISCYIVLMCTLAFAANLSNLVDVICNRISKPLFIMPVFKTGVTTMELIGFIVGFVLSGGYLITKHWLLNNILGASFCVMGLKKIGTSSLATGAIMLSGLFFYDIFWVFGSKRVFGSNVMVTVAKGVEGPIKLMFPRSMNGCGNLDFSMLGLGDIVVPGIYIAFLAKWDAVLMGQSKASSPVYLNACMVAYAFSLLTTVGVMLVFNAAQPALLYIVPYVLLVSAALAVVRKEFVELHRFQIPEGPPESGVGDVSAAQESVKKDD